MASCAGRAALLFRNRFDTRDEIEILLKVFSLETRIVAAPVVRREIVERSKRPVRNPRPSGL